MKKTKKALLAFTACAMVLSCATAFAACGNEDNDQPAAHSHTWSNWTVESADKPTLTAGGKATRTCSGSGNCDAKAEDKEHALPVLTNDAYSKSADSATCSAVGEIEYIYNSDGVNVRFAVETPVNTQAHNYVNGKYVNTDKEGHYQVCENNSGHVTQKTAHDTNGDDGACSVCGYKDISGPVVPEHEHSWGNWTVESANKPTLTAEGKATRTCSGSGDCDAGTEESQYNLPMLSDSAYTVNVSTPSTCTVNGTATYVYENDGVSVTFDAELPLNPDGHDVLKKQDGWAATCELQGREDYYSCGDCGKQYKDADGSEEFSNLTEIVIPVSAHKLTKVADNTNSKTVKYPDNSNVTFKNMNYHECEVCGKLFKDAEGTNQVTSVFSFSRRGMLLDFGFNSVNATGVTNATNGDMYVATYIADADATYTFKISDGSSISQIIYILTGTKVNSVVYSNGWQTSVAAYNKFEVADSTQPPANSVTVNMTKGEWITLVVDTAEFTVNVESEPVLKVGTNMVMITEADAMFIDEYEFVPTETKKYSMTVPEGVEVLMNNEDFIIDGNKTVNFQATKDDKIIFAFKNNKTGAVTVTIGEAVELPKITTDSPLNSLSFPAKAVNNGVTSSGVAVIEVGDIEEGTYKLSVVIPMNLMQGGVVCFGKNTSTDYTDYFESNGNFTNGAAEAYFQFPQTATMNGATYSVQASRNTWNITLDLKKGDVLVFANGGTTSGTLNITLTKV
ncbi:MAG: hypothetical protein K2I30_04410 [Clostridia bacterium]|nr:hypothetical protein [Clostridia bacterium]